MANIRRELPHTITPSLTGDALRKAIQENFDHLSGEVAKVNAVVDGQGEVEIDVLSVIEITADLIKVDSLDAITATMGDLTAGNITGTTITGGSITGTTITGVTITGSLFRTAGSGARVEIGYNDFEVVEFFNDSGSVAVLRSQGTGEFDVISTGTLGLYSTGGAIDIGGSTTQTTIGGNVFLGSDSSDALGFYGSVGATRQTISALTNSTGGTANDVVAAVSGSGDDATINNNFSDLTTKLNNLLTRFDNLGLLDVI